MVELPAADYSDNEDSEGQEQINERNESISSEQSNTSQKTGETTTTNTTLEDDGVFLETVFEGDSVDTEKTTINNNMEGLLKSLESAADFSTDL